MNVATPIDRADAVPAAQWNRLARRGFHLHRWHVVAEACGWRPRHVSVPGPDGLRAIVPAYLMGRDTYGNLHDRWTGSLGHLADLLRLRLAPTIAVTAPYGCASEPLGDLTRVSDVELDSVFDLLEARARDDGAVAVVWPHVRESEARLIDHARRRGYAALYAGAAARLDVPWAGLDEYVASRSKSVRRTVRAELRTLTAGALRTEVREDFRDIAQRVQVLQLDALRARNGRETQVTPELFARLAAEPMPGLWAQLTWAGERLVGASINLAAGTVIDGTFSAVAPSYQATPVYYGDLVYTPVRIACARRFAAIDLGPAALVPKVLRGARLYRRITLIRGTTAASHRTLSALGGVVSAWTVRKERRRLAVVGDALSRPGKAA